MYSGTTFRRDSGRIIGAHQKIDRVARRQLAKHISESVDFPSISNILHFEGKNGPDGLKLKNPADDNYEHSYNPADPNDKVLLEEINDHIINLSRALSEKDEIRAAFEAAWMAHSITDGLTPAHHYPSDDVTKESWLNNSSKLNDLKTKFIESNNDKKRGAFLEKWDSWGNGGAIGHIMFEWGVASAIAPNNFKSAGPNSEDIVRLKRYGFEKLFVDYAKTIYSMDMYNTFFKKGWTRKLAKQTKNELIPIIIKAVVLAWYQATLLSEENKR